MSPSSNYALAGAALFNPMAAMFWLDVARGRRPSRGLAAVAAAGAACAALAAPRGRPARAAGAGLLAAGAAAAAGLALSRFAGWLEGREAPAAPPDARAVILPAAAACAAAVGAVALAGRPDVEFAPYNGRPGHYRWISARPSPGARPSAWGGYLLHQLGIWGCIYVAQRSRPAYSDGMRPLNWAALGINAAGAALHYAQTRRYYDGLALDVPEGSALGSAAFVLMVIQAMEAPRRGLALGLGRTRLPPELVRFARRYHGYIFSWATIYTFWYHPVDPLPAHLGGLYHTLLLFVQSSLLFTRAHRDPRWTTLLELMVLPHAVITTLMKRSGFASMFVFGFSGMFVLTQMHGLGLSPRARTSIGVGYLGAALAWYAGRGQLRRLPDVLRVPVLEYGVLGLLALLTLVIRRWRRWAVPALAPPAR